MTSPVRVQPDPVVVKRQNDLFDLYNSWPGDGDPDDDPAFVARAHQIMGLPYHALMATPKRKPGANRSVEPDRDTDALRLRGIDLEVRLAGHDTHPGDPERLKEYWLTGKGQAKWVGSPHPWTSLYHHLLKYLPMEEAKRTAAEWFHIHFGFWPGADANRVLHGKPPRGHVEGPG